MTELLAALVGTMVGSFISWIANDYHNKLRATFDFHREFDSQALNESRILADKLILRNSDKLLKEIYDESPEESLHVWQVINFYRRLWIAIKYKQVRSKLISDLFGKTFFWWYFVCFEKQYLSVHDYSTSQKQIIDLKRWFDNHLDKSLLREWTEAALEEYKRRNYRE